MPAPSSPAAHPAWAPPLPATSSPRAARSSSLDVQEGPGQAMAAKLGRQRAASCAATSPPKPKSTPRWRARATRMGGINLLVNCAGVVGAGRVLGKNGPMAGDFFAKVVHINLIGTFLCDKAAANIMQNNTPTADGERGVLIHTASVAAFEGQIGQAAYSATKAGLAGMTLPIARELARFGIRCVSIAPGIFHTPMVDAMTPELQASLASQIPFPQPARQARGVRAARRPRSSRSRC